MDGGNLLSGRAAVVGLLDPRSATRSSRGLVAASKGLMVVDMLTKLSCQRWDVKLVRRCLFSAEELRVWSTAVPAFVTECALCRLATLVSQVIGVAFTPFKMRCSSRIGLALEVVVRPMVTRCRRGVHAVLERHFWVDLSPIFRSSLSKAESEMPVEFNPVFTTGGEV